MAIIPDGAAARSRRVRWVMAGVAVTVVVADQVTKSLVAAGRIADGSSFGWVTVNVVRNHGASGGIASGYPILVTLAALAITGLAATLALRAGGRTAAICLAAVLGGALGNLSDRIFRSPGFGRGGVVDWIHFAGGGGSLDLSRPGHPVRRPRRGRRAAPTSWSPGPPGQVDRRRAAGAPLAGSRGDELEFAGRRKRRCAAAVRPPARPPRTGAG